MNGKTALTILKQELLSLNSIIKFILLSLIFISVSMVLINYRSYTSFIFNDYPIIAKVKIIALIFIGSFRTVSWIDIFFLIIMGTLFGINAVLLIQKFTTLKKRGNLRILFGTGIISITAAGCASCGLSFASLIGLSAVLTILPLGGIELYIVAIIILTGSLLYNTYEIQKVCKIA